MSNQASAGQRSDPTKFFRAGASALAEGAGLDNG
jgi:hypothetical protein